MQSSSSLKNQYLEILNTEPPNQTITSWCFLFDIFWYLIKHRFYKPRNDFSSACSFWLIPLFCFSFSTSKKNVLFFYVILLPHFIRSQILHHQAAHGSMWCLGSVVGRWVTAVQSTFCWVNVSFKKKKNTNKEHSRKICSEWFCCSLMSCVISALGWRSLLFPLLTCLTLC